MFYTDNVQFLCEWNIQISLYFRIENIQISKIRRVSLFGTFSVQKLYVSTMGKYMENIQNKNVCYLHENCMDFFHREYLLSLGLDRS